MKLLVFFLCGSALFASPPALARKLLLVGDSLTCGPFGQSLFSQLEKAGHEVHLYCSVSSAPEDWLKGGKPGKKTCQTRAPGAKDLKACGGNGDLPPFAELLRRHPEHEVLLALGTNSLLSPQVSSGYEKMLRLLQQGSRTCSWIGPPQMHPSESKGFPKGRVQTLQENLNPFYDSLEGTLGGRCSLIDSRSSTGAVQGQKMTSDGVHVTKAVGQAWALAILPQLGNSGSGSGSAPGQQ